MPHRSLQPGTLWPAILRQTEHALQCGALRPIETFQEGIDDGGVRFLVRQVSSLARKDRDRDEGHARQHDNAVPGNQAGADPFLPYDPDLFVADISETHLALLNKFNVLDHHLLIVTRRFESQDALLNLADFEALLACMAEFDGLGFYNGGAAAGASQRHKHLQLVPLPLASEGPALPIAPLLAAARMDGADGTVPGLAFSHAFAPLALSSARGPDLARTALARYRALLEAVGVRTIHVDGAPQPLAPYNLLVTPLGMLLVPRSAESVEGISVNTLGFAGSFFVRNEAQMRTIERLGPMAMLRQAAGPPLSSLASTGRK
ncbi:ATP adenylyltransferase family protein [Cupriavidus basilensis]|nr:phosphorylase [Cupriavidus basilensis]